MSTVDFLAGPCSGLPLVPCCLALVGAVLSSAPARIQPRWVWASGLCLSEVGWCMLCWLFPMWGVVSEAVFGCLFRQCGCVGVCCSGCSSPVPCLLGGSSLHKVRGCPGCRRARRVSGAIARLELALAVRCGPLVVTPAKSVQNLIITLQNHLSPNETPHTQTVVSPCICFQPKAMKPKTPWIYQQKSPIIS